MSGKFIGVIIIMVIIVAAIVALGVFFIKKMSNKALTQPVKMPDGSEGNTQTIGMNSTQAFLPYDEVKEGMIRVGSNYRAVLECSSVNYDLMSEMEQNMLEDSFKTLFDSMDYVYAFYVQTRELDTRDMIARFKSDLEKISASLPACANYAMEFIQNFENANLSGVVVKKKYIIICADDESSPGTSEEDKFDMAKEVLARRVAAVQSKLNNVKIQCRRLNDGQLYELLKLAVDKKIGGNVDAVIDGEFTTDIVNGQNNKSKIDKVYEAEVDVAIKEFKNRLVEIYNEYGRNNPALENKNKQLLEDVDFLKRQHGGYNSIYKKSSDDSRFIENPDSLYNAKFNNTTDSETNKNKSTFVKPVPRERFIEKQEIKTFNKTAITETTPDIDDEEFEL